MNLDDLMTVFAAKVVDEMARRGVGAGQPPANEFSSSSLPPDVRTKARFNVIAPNVPGSRKMGQTWFVPADAWFAFRTKKKVVSVSRSSMEEEAERIANLTLKSFAKK